MDVEINVNEAIFKKKDGKIIEVPITDAHIHDEELILEKRFATPIVEHEGNKTVIMDGIGKFKDGSVIITGKVVEKLDKEISG